MRASLARCAEWLDLTVTLCRSPCPVFPRAALADQLAVSFGCAVSWNWIDADGSYGFELREPIPGFPTDEEAIRWSTEGLSNHPILRWYAATRDTSPMSVGRVPRILAPAGFDLLRELLAPRGLDEQLSIPYHLDKGSTRCFVLAQTGHDFSDEQLEVARLVQPLIAVLDRQSATLTRAGDDLGELDLTGRELAVLQLLREGLTAAAIGHRLMISPRTVHTHLGSIYRKLGVADRMQAVLVSQELGLLPLPGSEGPPAPHGLPIRWESPVPYHRAPWSSARLVSA